MIHGVIALLTCLVFLVLRFPMWLCLTPSAFYMGREFAQAEERIIKTVYGKKRANMPWYGGFLPQAWQKEDGSFYWKALFDWVLPLLVGVGAIIASTLI